jgi:hypothetical protein
VYLHCDVNRQKNPFVALWRVRSLHGDVHIVMISCLDEYYKRYDCLNVSIFTHNVVPYVVVGDISPFKDSFSYHYVI